MPKHAANRGNAAPKKMALNVRDFPPDLIWKCRERAAQKQMTLRAFVIDVLRTATQDGE